MDQKIRDTPVLLQHLSAGEVHGHVRLRTIASGRTAVQSFEIVELQDSGRALLLEGCLQSTERDEELYHESLVFPAYAHAPEVRSVLCLGGANGGLLKQVLKLPALERVLLVDIDWELHELSRVHLRHLHGDTLDDARVTLLFDDPVTVIGALGSAANRRAPFDLIIADLPDATAGSYATGLFTREFYASVSRILSEWGVYVTQAGQAHYRHCRFLNRVLRTLTAAFAHAVPYAASIPAFGTPWTFVLASQGVNLHQVTEEEIAERIEMVPGLVAYDAESHAHMFHLPRVLRTALARPEPLITNHEMALVSVAANLPVAG